MEGRINALEKWTSNQGKVNVEVKMDLAILKDSLQDIKEMLRNLKRKRKVI